MASQLDRILQPDYLGDLAERSMDDIRSMRAECQETETGLSYLRRLVQGRLDIVGAELQGRRDGRAPRSLSEIVAELPEILGAHLRAPGLGRLPLVFAPDELDPELASRLDAIVSGGALEQLPEMSEDDLVGVQEGLAGLEREISDLRRRLFDRIDELQAEIVRRYRTGETTVESLLR